MADTTVTEPAAREGALEVPVTDDDTSRMWTSRLRRGAVKNLPPEQLLPDRQPAYVSSWIYVFGVLTLAAFVVILFSGAVIALEGPQWYHVSKVGLWFNSLHLWSVELFFFFMVIHLWGKFWMAAWRGRRAMTWITGAVAFVASVGCAFTGYLVQSNFDSQWISTQAKDGINSVGLGAWFNVMDYGQMLLFHVLLLPVTLAFLIGVHVVLVRRRGVVPPLPLRGSGSASSSASSSDAAELSRDERASPVPETTGAST
jgi:ubiquinol-cytochrome c reductase cytochrome b subunit